MRIADKNWDSIHSIVVDLIELTKGDTLYHDLYRQRAAEYLEHELSRADYHNLKQHHARIASLPNQIRNSMMHHDWQEVRDLSALHTALRDEYKDTAEVELLADKIYAPLEIPVDPFSPGMHQIAGIEGKKLPALKKEIVQRLERLSQADSQWKEFYLVRLKLFKNLILHTDKRENQTPEEPVSVLEEEAIEALEDNNLAQLEHLAAKILDESTTQKKLTPAELYNKKHTPPEDYHFDFTRETLVAASKLGLQSFSVPSRYTEYAPLSRFAWNPTYSNVQNNQHSVLQVPDIPLPKGTPQGMKSRLQLFAIHPFINSAGVRYLPTMLAEDSLVEDFPEPEAGSELSTSGLIQALGLKQRNLLNRKQIETALAEKGHNILLNDLGLDPTQFKIVCIPPDLHLRIGQDRGWGQQKIWTHFDGYMIMSDSNKRALAGGDVRYGGIYDLLGLSINYDSERVIARFAVVQRRRLKI
jgi:hypothetical protein